jgi:NAD(P)H dehydrogenase (quinone)
MALIAIAFHSGFGHTLRQAQAVAAGAGSVAGAQAKLFAVETLTEADWAEHTAERLGARVAETALTFKRGRA